MYSTRQRSRSPFIEGTRLPSRSTLQSYRNVRNSSLSGHSSNYKSESSFASLSPSFRRVRDLDLGVSDSTFRRQSRAVERLASEMPDRFMSPSRLTVLRPPAPPTSFFKETCESPTRLRELRSYSPASVPTSIETRQPRSLPHPSVPVVNASSEFYSARRRLEGDSDIPVSSSNTKSDVLFDIPSRSPRSLSSIRTTPSYRMPVSHVNFKDYYRPPIRERPIIRSDYVPRSRADRERTNMPIVRERRMIKFREMSKDIMNNVKRRISWVMPDDLGSPMIENLSANRERDEQLTEDLFNNRSRESSASRIRSTDNSVGRMRSREVTPTRTNSPKSAERSVQSMEVNFNRLRSPRHSLEPQNMTQCVVENVPTPHRRRSKETVGLKGIKSVKSKSTLNERRLSGENGVKLMNNEVDVQQLHRRKNSTADDKSCKPDISVDHTGHPRSRRRRRETPPAVEEENSCERSRRRVRGVPLDYVRCHSRKSAESSKEANVASAVDVAEVPKSEKFSKEFVNHIPMCYANLDGGDGYSSKVTQECPPVEEKQLPLESTMPSKGKQSKIENILLAEREKSDLKKCVPIVPKKDEEKRTITTGLTTAKFTGKSKDISKIKVGDSTNRGDISIIGKEVKKYGDAIDGQEMLLSEEKSNVSTKTTFPNRHDSAPDTQNTSKAEEQSNRAIKGISQRYIGGPVANSGKEPENAVTHKSQPLYIEKADTASNSHPSENKLPITDDHVKKISKIIAHDKNSTGSEETRKSETLGKTSRKPPGRSISTEVIKSFDAPTVGEKSKSSEACSQNTVKMNILNKDDTKCKQSNALHNKKDSFLNGIATLAPKDRGTTANSVTGKYSKEISASLPKRTLLDEAPKISLVKHSVTKSYVNSLESNSKCVAETVETVATGESKATENFVKSNASAAKITKNGFPKTAAGPEVISTKNVYTSNSVRDSKKPDSPKEDMQIFNNKCVEAMNENSIILAETSTDRIETAVDENDIEGKRSILSQGNKFISDARKVLPVLNDETKGKILNEIRGEKEECGDATLGVAVLRREAIDQVKRVAGHTKVEDKMKAQTFMPKDGSSFIFMKERYPKGVEDDGKSHSKTVSITKEIVEDTQRDALTPKTEIANNTETHVSLKCIAKTPVEGNIPGTYGIPLNSVGDKNKTHDARGIKNVQSTGKEEPLAVVTQTESKNEVPVSHILKCVPRFKADTATAGSVNGSGTVVENLDEPRQRTVLESAFSERDDMVKPGLLTKAGDKMGSKVISSFARDSCTDSGTKTGLPKEIPVVTVKNNGVYQEKSVNIAQKIVLEDFVSRKANADVSKSNVDLKNKLTTVKRIEESLSERNALSGTRPSESHADQVKAQPGIEIRPKHPDDSYLSGNKTAAKFADADKRDHALVKNGKESGLILKDHGGVAADSETASQGARHTSKPESFDKGTPHDSNNSILVSSENLEEGKGDLSPGSRGSGREHYNITIKTKSEGVKEHSNKIMNMDSNVAKLVPKGKEVNVSLRNGDFVNKDHPEYPKNTAVLEDSSLALNSNIDSSRCMETKSDNRHDASMGRDFVKESDVSIEVRLNLAGAAKSPGLIVPEKNVSTNFTIKLPKESNSEVPKSLKKVVDSDVVKVNCNTKDKQREEKQPVFSEKSLPSGKVDSEEDSKSDSSEDSKSDSSEDSESDSSEDSEDDSSSSSSESRLDNERNNYHGNGQKEPRRFIGLVTRAMPLLYHDLKQSAAPPTGRLSDCERKSNSETSFSLSEDTSEKSQPPKLRFRKYTIDDFQFLKLLGKGSYGKVLLAELKGQNSYFAVKCLKKDFMLDDVESTMIERRVLALGTQHPYMCKLYCTFQTDSYLFFVMEYLNGGDLMFHIQESRKFDIDRARFYGAEIVSALKFLHKRGIVYRDIKLDNVVMDEQGHVRLVDFGMCQCRIYKEECRPYNFCGTPTYIAPEILMGQTYNQSVDWWSFGVLLFEMLNGRSPFKGTDEDELFWSVCNEEPYYPRFLCKEAIDILQQLLIKSPTERLGMPTCASGDITEHAFFSPIDWVKLEMKQIQPPFKPSVRFATDTSNFDSTFTMDSATLTPVESDILHSMDQEQFRGFSYTNPHVTN